MAAVTFSSTAKLLFDFSTSLENITEIDESLLLSKLSGESGSNLSSGLTLAANSLLNNSTAGFRNVRTVVVFLLTQQKYDLSGISNSDLMALQNASVDMYTFGVDQSYNLNMLNILTSPPYYSHSFNYVSTTMLDDNTFRAQSSQKILIPSALTSGTGNCNPLIPTDIVFVLDSASTTGGASSWSAILQFAANIVGLLPIGPSQTQ